MATDLPESTADSSLEVDSSSDSVSEIVSETESGNETTSTSTLASDSALETDTASPLEAAVPEHPLRELIVFGLLFAIVSLLTGLCVVAHTTLPHILVPGEYINYQDVTDGLPVPRLLAWNLGFIDLLTNLRDLSGLPLLMAGVFVFGPLWLLAVRRINPTFRLFGPAAMTSSMVAPLEFYGLLKASTLLVLFGLPFAALWILVDFGENGASLESAVLVSHSAPLIGPVWLMRFVLLGCLFWVGFHREGVAGDFTRQEWNPARRLLPLFLRGGLFGLMAYGLCRIGLPQHMEDTLLRLQTLGAFNISLWNWFASRCLFAFGMVGGAFGALFVLLTSRQLSFMQRTSLFFVTLAACGCAVLAQQDFSQARMASRLDIRPEVIHAIPEDFQYRPDRPNSGVPDTSITAKELARQLHLTSYLPSKADAGADSKPATPPPGRTLVFFGKNDTLLTYLNGYTLDGLLPDAASEQKVSDFLKQREYKTAFSWIAMKHLYNVRLMQFDMTGGIEVGLRDLTNCPHNRQFANTLLQMFSVCAATPQNQALLDRWADEALFDFPDRDSRRLMGDLYRRFGNPDKALWWYRKADMPASFLKDVQSQQIMFHEGRIEGTLLLNGKPLAGVQVAVAPRRMNGLTRGLEPIVFSAQQQMLSQEPRFTTRLFPLFHTQPYSLRWLSAATTTDSQGHYRIEHLTEGAYTVLCTLPPAVQTTLPLDDRLHISQPPHPFTVNYVHPGIDMGTTSIEFNAVITP